MTQVLPVNATKVVSDPSIICPHCGREWWNPHDVREHYCPVCGPMASPWPTPHRAALPGHVPFAEPIVR